MEWWSWIILGLVLLGGEVITPGGFFLCFFGVSAIIVGALDGLELAGPPWLQWLLFSVLSLVLLLFVRNRLKAMFPPNSALTNDRDGLVGKFGAATSEIHSGKSGQIDLRGTVWTARNVGNQTIHNGAQAIVVKVEGLSLDVKAEDEK